MPNVVCWTGTTKANRVYCKPSLTCADKIKFLDGTGGYDRGVNCGVFTGVIPQPQANFVKVNLPRQDTKSGHA